MTYVIGAGLAGLAAGYTLAQAGEGVTILEALDYPGGRVRSLEVDGHMVDFGGFIIYPWYTEYHRLAEELGMKQNMKKLPDVPIYYELEPNTFTAQDDVKFPIKDTLRLYKEAMPKLLRNRTTIDAPALHAFDDMSIAEFIRTAEKRDEKGPRETYADIVSQGYCYGPVTDYRMALVAPVVFNTTFRGDIDKSVSYEGHNGQFPEALASAIIEMGGTITYGEQVQSIDNGVITTSVGTYTADKIVYAARYQSEPIASIIGEMKPAPYTHFYNCVIEFAEDPIAAEHKDWGAMFYLPDESLDIQILSAVNIHRITEGSVDSKFVNFNVVDKSGDYTPKSDSELLAAMQAELARRYPNHTPVGVTAEVHWPETMPVATEAFIEHIQSIQGQDNIWFAGDALGSPSMETALRTGIHAAEMLLETLDKS